MMTNNLIKKPGKVLTAKGADDVPVITPHEKGETISLVPCCSAESRFLPPMLITNPNSLMV